MSGGYYVQHASGSLVMFKRSSFQVAQSSLGTSEFSEFKSLRIYKLRVIAAPATVPVPVIG